MSSSQASVRCPICGAPPARSLQAETAGFIQERTGIGDDAACHFCTSCDHAFFTPLLEPEQLSRLYMAYRGSDYTEMRVRHEPEYAELAVAFDDPESDYHRARRRYYETALASVRDLQGLVVDFGGHDGALARRAFPRAEVVVLDDNHERNAAGAEDALTRADLVFATHVFEHLSRPREILAGLVERVRAGTLFFLEVPKEYGAVSGGSLGDAFDRLDAAHREGRRPRHSLSLLHEHVAQFSTSSLRRLAEAAGLTVLEDHVFDPATLSLLARRPA